MADLRTLGVLVAAEDLHRLSRLQKLLAASLGLRSKKVSKGEAVARALAALEQQLSGLTETPRNDRRERLQH
jgi:hypothetical protein